MPKNLFAHTSNDLEFPEYISINEVDGKIKVTVRSPKKEPDLVARYSREGDTACATLPKEQIAQLIASLEQFK